MSEVKIAESSPTAEGTRYLTRSDIAKKFNLSERYLERLAGEGGGPPSLKIGRAVRYPEDLADAWARSKLLLGMDAA